MGAPEVMDPGGPPGARRGVGVGAEVRHWSATDLATALGQPAPTPEQIAVIEAPLRSLLVVAGAGSGKTETMASRVVWLVANQHVEPDEILGLTFTRKAAAELSERLTARLATLRAAGIWTPVAEEGAEVLGGTPTVSTYHAYAGQLVAEHGLRLGFERETRLLSEAAAWQVAHDAVVSYDGPVGSLVRAESTLTTAVLDLAGEMAEHLVPPDRLEAHLVEVIEALESMPLERGKSLPADLRAAVADLRERRVVVDMVRRFRKAKRRQGSMDFADQMELAARIARDFPDVGAQERSRYRAVFLDEFQDTSEAQLTFLRSLFVAEGVPVPVTAVGDPHQSIYGWRGASATTLDRFRDDFVDCAGGATVRHLSTSWRNDVAILDAADVTAEPLTRASRVEVRPLAARADAGEGSVSAARLETVAEEAAHVADWIAGQRARAQITTSAVLCRKRSQFPAIVAALEDRGLPYEVVGLGGLLQTPEVTDLVAALWIVQDPTRGDQLMRLLTGPLVQIGAADLDGLHVWARQRQHHDGAQGRERQVSLIEALDDLPPTDWRGPRDERVSGVASRRLGGLARIVRALRGLTALPLPELVGEAERALGLDLEVMSRPEYSPSAARAHLDAFADVAAQFAASADRPTLGGFLDWLTAALAEERGLDLGWIETSPDAVQVMTVHAAKGLEWDAVAIPGLVETSFPAYNGRVSWSADSGWKCSEPKNKAWLLGAGTLPFDLRGDRDGLPSFGWRHLDSASTATSAYDSFLADCGAHELREERRLMYVAVTRARHALFLTAHVWPSGKTARVLSRFLEELLDTEALGIRLEPEVPMPEPDESGVVPENPSLAEPTTAPWPVPVDLERTAPMRRAAAELEALRSRAALVGRGRDAAATTDAPARGARMSAGTPASEAAVRWDETIELLLRERDARRRGQEEVVSLPRHLSTSALVSLAEDPVAFAQGLRRPMPEPPALAARQGTAFHAWVEQHYARAAIVDILDLPGASDEAPADDAGLPRLKENFLASEWAQRIPVEIETPLETVIDGIAVRGRVDAVFADGDGWIIVDWKTGARPPGEAARLRALQLAAYRVAWARLREVSLERVRAAFFYAARGETVWPEMPGPAEIMDVLAQVPEA
jgi:DNA helicase-2/ATP-dependent DNA helicase PcrA